MSDLQVQALARGVSGEQYLAIRILGEFLSDSAPIVAPNTAVDC
jgi:hypothetical protein